ncbi:MAG TPA: CAP domain-containing protein [Gaiellaceae bacterium]|nr:CAP domain-containing protein [Gaiellaceae bacterium]
MSGGIRTLLALVAVLAAAVAASPSGAREQAGRSLTARNGLENGVLAEINALRRQHGLAPLRLNVRLRAAADAHSAAMANRGFFAHESADGTVFWKRVARFYPQGSNRYWSVGENLLWSSPDVDPAGALRMWLGSPPHRKNLLTTRWREIGLSAVHVTAGPGVFNNAPVTVLTADFGVRR